MFQALPGVFTYVLCGVLHGYLVTETLSVRAQVQAGVSAGHRGGRGRREARGVLLVGPEAALVPGAQPLQGRLAVLPSPATHAIFTLRVEPSKTQGMQRDIAYKRATRHTKYGFPNVRGL